MPNSDELIELTSFPPSGPVKVQEDLVHLAFQVNSLEETIADLQANGVNITDGPTQTSSGSRFLFIDAPDGYEIELIERPPGVNIVYRHFASFPADHLHATFLRRSHISPFRGVWHEKRLFSRAWPRQRLLW